MTEDAKKSAIALYESCAFDQLLGETLRPGGLKLTARIAEVAGIGPGHTVLDIACGKGTTAFFLAREYHCQVIAVDLSDKMISLCRHKAGEEKLSDKVSFLLGDGENLPFQDCSFDVIISECSFSLLPNKEVAARGIRRVLKPGGNLVMTDITLRGEVDSKLRKQITFACCLAGALMVEEYVNLLERAGFQYPHVEDHSPELRKVVYQLGITFGSMDNFVGRLPAGPCQRKVTVSSGTTSAQSYEQFLRLGKPGYALIAMTRR